MTEEQIGDILQAAQEQVPVQSWWKHRKGEWYRVIAIALEESTRIPVVVYCPLFKPQLCWTRPLSEFTDGRFSPEERFPPEEPTR